MYLPVVCHFSLLARLIAGSELLYRLVISSSIPKSNITRNIFIEAFPCLPFGLRFVVFYAEPLQVFHNVGAFALQGPDVVYLVAGAGQARLPGGWTGVQGGKVAQYRPAARYLCK